MVNSRDGKLCTLGLNGLITIVAAKKRIDRRG